MKRHHLFLLCLVLSLTLHHIPYGFYLSYPLLLISTVAHEMGHGLMALLMGGHFHALEMHADGSGVAHYSGRFGSLTVAIVAAAGLLGPALAAWLALWAARQGVRARRGLAVSGIACLLATLLVVRGVFAPFFIGGLGVLLLVLSRKASLEVCRFTLAFLGVQLGLACFTRSDYLFTRTAGGDLPSDVEQIAQHLFLPYWFWGGLIAILTLLVLAQGARGFLREGR
jgi:hypothetical protein